MDLLQCSELSLVHLPHRSTYIRSHFHLISVTLLPLVWVGPPISASSSTNLLSPTCFVVPQTPSVPPTPCLRWKSFFRIVGSPAHACVSYQSSPPQILGPSQKPCRIDTQSGQCYAATSSVRSRADSIFPVILL